MNKKQKKKIELKKNISIIINMVLIILGIIGFIETIRMLGKYDITYYTLDSNLLAIFVEILYLYFLVIKEKIPRWLQLLKYIATLSLVITFVVVVLVLAPLENNNYRYFLLYGSQLYYHTLCPIIAFISFLFLENYKYEKKDILYALSFTIIYAIISILLNCIGVMNGPYPFLKVRINPWYISILWFIVILGLSYLLSYFLYYSKNLINKNTKYK